MPAYDNNKNPMPEKICIRNEDWSSSSISYESYMKIYEAMCKKEFLTQCKSLMQMYAGNHMFKIKVPETLIYHDDYYTIRGAQHAVMFMHVLALVTGESICLLDKDMKKLVSVKISETEGYKIYDKKFLKSYGSDDEVRQYIVCNYSIWRMLNKFSSENYDGDFIVYGKRISQNLGFIYAIKDASELSKINKFRQVYIYDKNKNAICIINSYKAGWVTIQEPDGRDLGNYKLEWLPLIQASTSEDIIKKLTTNIEYICDKLLDNKYDVIEAGVDISKLSQNVRSFT